MGDVSIATQRDRLRRWLEARGTLEPATLQETHVSILAFTADRVWKCKKAVEFPFIDLSTASRRLANCEREVALNRRLAPDVYLGVVPLVDDDQRVVDHLVEMRRLPGDRRLSTIAERDAEGGTDCIDRVAAVLVRFHGEAPTGGNVDRSATPAALTDLWTRNIAELEHFVGPVLDPSAFERVNADAHQYLAGRAALLEERIAHGRIRDGHGDLLADDVFCLRDAPRILDCLEFDDGLRYGDVLADVAFLAMDLERIGRLDLARRFLDRYRQGADDRWPRSLEHFYIAYRALVRAKVACLQGSDDAVVASARTLLALAARHLERGRVRLVLIGGPPATGKTTVARALARATGWPVLHSDEIRKELAGVGATTSAAAPLGRGLYSESWSERTYATMLDRAREMLERGSSVVLDASWSTEARRLDAASLATATSSELSMFACEVAPEIAEERASERARAARDASDASASIAAELRSRFAPWPGSVVLDTTRSPEVLADAVLERFGITATEA